MYFAILPLPLHSDSISVNLPSTLQLLSQCSVHLMFMFFIKYNLLIKLFVVDCSTYTMYITVLYVDLFLCLS